MFWVAILLRKSNRGNFEWEIKAKLAESVADTQNRRVTHSRSRKEETEISPVAYRIARDSRQQISMQKGFESVDEEKSI